MQDVTMVLALVCLNIKETRTQAVDQNVYLATIVQETKLVLETNVLILALELVEKMLSAKLPIIFQSVHAEKIMKEMLSQHVHSYEEILSFHVILAARHRVDPTHNAEK